MCVCVCKKPENIINMDKKNNDQNKAVFKWHDLTPTLRT